MRHDPSQKQRKITKRGISSHIRHKASISINIYMVNIDIFTDHQPLQQFFSEINAVLPMISGRIKL